MANYSINSYIFTARSDTAFIDLTLPPIFSMHLGSNCSVSVIIDTRKAAGVLGTSLPQTNLDKLNIKLQTLKKKNHFVITQNSYDPKLVKQVNKHHLGRGYSETHCFRGYPIYGSFKQFTDSEAKYILHIDCDMIFYEAPGFSWIQEGVRIMEENPDILCVLPRGGPPTQDGSLHQGTTEYWVDDRRGLYLFKNFTSRHYLIHRERFMSLLPLKPKWLSWREPIKSRLFGNGKMLCWETMVEQALENSKMWRADLMTVQAWSLHPGDRSAEFYQLLPQIIDSVGRNEFPEKQRGHFDLRLNDWKHFLN